MQFLENFYGPILEIDLFMKLKYIEILQLHFMAKIYSVHQETYM